MATETTAPLSAEDLVNLEQLILSYLRKIEDHKQQYKKHKDMLDGIFENSEQYKEALAKVKEVSKQKNEVKNQLLQLTEARQINDKLKDFRADLKQLQTTLSAYLQQFLQNSASPLIEDEQGSLLEIVYSAKVVKKSI